MSWMLPPGLDHAPEPTLEPWRAHGLSPRLAAVAEEIPPGAVVNDVGTDHGWLATALVASGRCPRVIASDLRRLPLEVAARTVSAAGQASRVELRLGPGLSTLSPGEASVACFCGMGSAPIVASMLAHPPETLGIDRLVFQVNRGLVPVRRHLERMGWRPVRERFVVDGRNFFCIMAVAARPADAPPATEADLWLGFDGGLPRGPLMDFWLRTQLHWLEPRLASLLAAGAHDGPEARTLKAARQILVGALDS